MDHEAMRELRKQYRDGMKQVNKLKASYEREKAEALALRPAMVLSSEDLARELEARGYNCLADDLRRRISGEG